MDLNQQLSNEYLSGIKSLQLKTELILRGTMTGWHPSPFHGYSSEFSQYRNYCPGDELKHLDWKAYARTERPVVRQYRDETNTNVYIVLDSSESMSYRPETGTSKLDYAVVMAASLAFLAYRQRDAFTLVHGSGTPSAMTRPRNTASNLKQTYAALETITGKGVTDLEALFGQLSPSLRPGSMTYIITDLWQETSKILSGLKSIQFKSQATTIIHLLTPEELGFFEFKNMELTDLETKEKIRASAVQLREEYLALLNEHRTRLRNECANLKIRFVEIDTQMPYFKAMRKVLGKNSGSVIRNQ